MTQQEIIDKTAEYIKEKFAGEGTGHDWWHIYRVWQLAKEIASQEGQSNLFVVELGALLHDIADWKFHGGDSTVGSKLAREFLAGMQAEGEVIEEVEFIVEHISYKGGTNPIRMRSLEGKIVQDADRLDALGAIGVARAFAYGGHKGRPLYDPNIKPMDPKASFEAYQKYEGTTVNHFYEKLLLIKDLMNTETGRKIARFRHQFIEDFLKEFYSEWEGNH